MDECEHAPTCWKGFLSSFSTVVVKVTIILKEGGRIPQVMPFVHESAWTRDLGTGYENPQFWWVGRGRGTPCGGAEPGVTAGEVLTMPRIQRACERDSSSPSRCFSERVGSSAKVEDLYKVIALQSAC